jgi:hypothetical protein
MLGILLGNRKIEHGGLPDSMPLYQAGWAEELFVVQANLQCSLQFTGLQLTI